MIEAVRANDYVQRMQPHVFGDKEFVLQLTTGAVLYEDEGFMSGGVKLIHFLKKKQELSLAEFDRRWREQHAPALLEATRGQGLIRKYVQNPQSDFERAFFKGRSSSTAASTRLPASKSSGSTAWTTSRACVATHASTTRSERAKRTSSIPS